MTTSNLSKIKPKLRTSGRVSGNFGKSKVKAGSPLLNIGITKTEHVKLTTQEEYMNRLCEAYTKTDDNRIRQFIYNEIKKIKIQRGQWAK